MPLLSMEYCYRRSEALNHSPYFLKDFTLSSPSCKKETTEIWLSEGNKTKPWLQGTTSRNRKQDHCIWNQPAYLLLQCSCNYENRKYTNYLYSIPHVSSPSGVAGCDQHAYQKHNLKFKNFVSKFFLGKWDTLLIFPRFKREGKKIVNNFNAEGKLNRDEKGFGIHSCLQKEQLSDVLTKF